ncbi:helix-turn-helix transcriptional regulator [Microbacterium natoriense]|uniref:helix-turn-helix domain-containing protein n=1 Tax=Microbacterium natoriense TaxID=284570 RepID=UPI0031DBF7C1
MSGIWVGAVVDNREVLGRALREARRSVRMPIAAVAREAHLSSSTLQRAETGAATLSDPDVERLDRVLGAGGGLLALYRSLMETVRPPLYSFQRATAEAGHRWPAEWTGIVWVLVRSEEPIDPSRIDLTWGPWRFRHEWTGGHLLLEDWKVLDDVSVPINVRLMRRADVIFGTGEVSPRPPHFVDLRGQWERDDPQE